MRQRVSIANTAPGKSPCSIGYEADEQQLHVALVDGDEGAFDWLVHRNRPGMLRVACTILDNPELAEDVVQETFESVYKDIGSFRGESRLSSWIYRILVNRARRVGKREKRMVPLSTLARVEPSEQPDRSPVDPQEQAIVRQGLAMVAEHMQQLPERQRAMVMLRDVQGLECDEVEAKLQVSPGNQRVLLHRGRAALRRAAEAREHPTGQLLN